jgi:threonine dehydrogenase-like Zn-dependent dehydrogenase
MTGLWAWATRRSARHYASVRMRRLLRLLETGRVGPTPMTTHTCSFEEGNRAFELMRMKKENTITPLIRLPGVA